MAGFTRPTCYAPKISSIRSSRSVSIVGKSGLLQRRRAMSERRVQGWIWMAAMALAVVATGQSCTAWAGNAVPIHTFGGAGDGYTPSSGLIKDAQGNLYGVTSDGGQ